jgi:hypothetical protein
MTHEYIQVLCVTLTCVHFGNERKINGRKMKRTMVRTEESLSCLIKENPWHGDRIFPFVTKDGNFTSKE